uniref:Palmitoyltransferase n=1 Tax=Lepisosteus oculatus TaxID=7918 RepID=W5N4W3_LEPOC
MVPAHHHPLLNLSGQKERCSEKGQSSRSLVGSNKWDIFQSAKLGRLEECKRIIDAEGPEVLSRFDAKGYTPAHWAALNGFSDLILCFIECKGAVNLFSQADLALRPIHWAAVNGHIAVVDLLLRAGVPVDSPDQRGCTPLILAAQFGHSALCCYLMGKGARLDACDCEGDSAVHWAAFKESGHCELTRLLIYAGLSPTQPDHFGQTPLHLAVLSGDLLTVQLLCEQIGMGDREDGVELETQDKNGYSPLKLSRVRKHYELSEYLENLIIVLSEHKYCKLFLKVLLYYATLFTFLLITTFGTILLRGSKICHIKQIIITLQIWLYNACQSSGLFASMGIPYLLSKGREPIFLSWDTDTEFKASPFWEILCNSNKAVHFEEWKGGRNPLERLCHTCHIVKPFRTKHCRVTNRCVEQFDHYCPYIYNDVGRRNRIIAWQFLIFLVSSSKT